MTLRSQHVRPEDLFFWKSHHNSDKTATFSPSVLEFTKQEIRHIVAGPGPTFGSRRPCTYCIIVSALQFNCIIDVTVDDLDRFDLLIFFFILRLTICPVINFVFLHRHENSYLLFHPRFSLNLYF